MSVHCRPHYMITAFLRRDNHCDTSYPIVSSYFVCSVRQTNYGTKFEWNDRKWCVKGYSGWVYVVVTDVNYPDIVAIECLDELHEVVHRANQSWTKSQRDTRRRECCLHIGQKYGTLDETSFAHDLLTCDNKKTYTKIVAYRDVLHYKMSENIQNLLSHMEDIEALAANANELNAQAEVFKKHAQQLRRKVTTGGTWTKLAVTGIVVAGTSGFLAGFLAGGPASAVVLIGMDSIVGAQLIEASAGSLLFMAGFWGIHTACDTWFWNQPHVHVAGSIISGRSN
jgi:Synaptobrevin